MSSRWVCAACGGWCEVLTEKDEQPSHCPYDTGELMPACYPDFERIEEDEKEEEEESRT